MRIYIASSWRNRHAVEMLSDLLEDRSHSVLSFIRAGLEDEGKHSDEWIASEAGAGKFNCDIQNAIRANLVVYISPSGTDAWAEVGAAWAKDIPVYGIWAKGEPAGLMRRMVTWFYDYRTLLTAIDRRSHD